MNMLCTRSSASMTLVVLGAAMISASCESPDEEIERVAADYQERLKVMEREGIVAGPREKTIAEKYDLKISLPMPETEFLALLHRLNLRYEKWGERGGPIEIGRPWHSDKLDLSQIERTYQIYGEPWSVPSRATATPGDRTPGMGEAYVAYVDKHNRVVYIENSFNYPPF